MLSLLFPVTLIVLELGPGSADKPYLFAKDGHAMLFKLTNQKDPTANMNDSSCEEISNRTRAILNLNSSSLTAFPSCLPRTLKNLDLSNNNLSVVDYHKIAELPELLVLALSRNNIREIDWRGGILKSLETLDLSYNLLTSVPVCHSMLNLKWLSLAGNPLKEIKPLAFSCFPNLAFLNLSATLRNGTGDGIGESAFSVGSNDGITKKQMANLTVLDLSSTFLANIRQEWTKDLANLRELHIAKMPRLESLNLEEFKYIPLLEVLNCQDSPVLSWIETRIFEGAPHLKALHFQNCNLSSFDRWNINSSNVLYIGLIGNPLNCSCELSWLLSDPEGVILLRAEETTCNRTESRGLPSLSLLNLHEECQTIGNGTLPEVEKVTYASTPFDRDTATQAPTATEIGANTFTEIYSTESVTEHSTGTALQAPHNTLPDDDSTMSRSTSAPSAFISVPTALPSWPFGESSNLPSTISSAETEQMKQNATQAITVKMSTTITHIPRDYVPDFEDEDEDVEKSAVPQKDIRCDYHPCKHLQKPCQELQRMLLCYCPGLSADSVIPDPPRLREVSEITDTSVQIHWCAPNSIVHRYQLVYHPEGSENRTVVDNIYVTARQYTVYNLLPDTTYHVCVITINKAGSSQEMSKNVSRIPCTKFKTRPSYLIILAALCTASGILLLVIIILSACLYKKCNNPLVGQYDTHLVAYKNPAFDYSLKMQTFN